MMIDLGFTTHELAYLLGSVGGMLRHTALAAHDRLALEQLRDRIAPYVSLDADVVLALRLPAPELPH